jgi:hypothetical protein
MALETNQVLRICATENHKKGTAFIFLIDCFLEFCKNKRGWKTEGQ